MMNPLDWEDSVRRWQINNNSHQNDDGGRMENTPGTCGSHSYCQYRGDTVNDPQNRPLALQGGPCPSTNNWEDAELCDPDGKPWETDQEDHELTRKLRELRELEEKIMCRKVSIACKTVLEPSLAACDERSDRCTGPALKDRVNAILQQRRSNGSLSKSHFHRNRIKSSGPRKGDQQQEDHPLKIRVSVLMKHRMVHPCVSPSNTQRTISPPAEENIDQGFQRFLNVLNKGVDVDLLRRIVNDDSEDLCLDAKLQDIQHREVTDSPFRRETQYSNDEISLSGHSGSGERRTDPRSQEGSRSIPTPDHDESKEEALSPFSSKTLSNAPSGIKNKKGEEEKIMHDEQHEQLQNILKSLGLQLEVEEMSKLANRTQERLYGKKAESAESRQKPDRRPRSSPKTNRSSSSSSPSPSRSSSRSSSSSSSYCRNSGSGRGPMPEGDSSRGRSSETLTRQEDDQRLKDGNEGEIQFTDQPSYQAFPPPDPSYSFTPLPDYALSQYSHYSAYGTDAYEAASSYWTNSQVPTYPSFHPSSYPCTQDERPHFPIAVLGGTRDVPPQAQVRPPPDRQSLQVIRRHTTVREQLKKSSRARNLRRRMLRKNRRQESLLGLSVATEEEEPAEDQRQQQVDRAEKSHSSVPVGHDSKAKASERSERRLTEEEIKAKLRKTLEAFNRKAKEAATRPISSLSSQTDEDLLMKL